MWRGWDCAGLVSGVKCLTQGHNISGKILRDLNLDFLSYSLQYLFSLRYIGPL